MYAFYAPVSAFQGEHVLITGDEAHHLNHVLRGQVGDTVEIRDGEGHAYQAQIESIQKKT